MEDSRLDYLRLQIFGTKKSGKRRHYARTSENTADYDHETAPRHGNKGCEGVRKRAGIVEIIEN